MTTYTPSLRLWQGTPGDPAIKNQWGPPLNTNDTLVENAITDAAVIDVTGLTAYTLTVVNGGADQARPLLQQFINNPGGTCTVTLPNVPKVGYAQNSTTGGFNIILTAGTGTQSTIPPDGYWHFYVADGAGNVTLPIVLFGTPAAPGAAQFTSGTFSGPVSMTALTATSGNFSGGAISGGALTATTGTFSGAVSTGALTAASVRANGAVIATSLTASGGLSAASANVSGVLSGSSATFSGNLTAGTFTPPSINVSGTGTFGNINTPTIGTPGGALGINAIGVVIPFTAFTAIDLNQSGVGNGNGIVVNIATPASGFAVWQFGGTTVGSITQSNLQTFYNTTSDQRLKTDQGELTGFHSGRIIDKLRPKWFCWKSADDDTQAEPGFFAQQVYRIFPWAVTKGKGKPGSAGFKPWQMDASKLMPVVIAELQALRERVADLERRP